jgi:hypothetical protein
MSRRRVKAMKAVTHLRTNLFISLILTGAFTVSSLNAAEYRLLDVDQLDMSYEKFTKRRDAQAPQYGLKDWDHRVSMDVDFRLLRYGFWENWIHTEAIPGKVKTVGWDWKLGANLGRYVDVYYHHHSQHVMDEPQIETGNPVEDSYGFRLKFIDRPRRAP